MLNSHPDSVHSRRSALGTQNIIFALRAPSYNHTDNIPHHKPRTKKLLALNNRAVTISVHWVTMEEKPGSTAELRGYSCLACRQRKVKCDRHSPCSNCAKSAQQCLFVPPTRGKRKRTKTPREGLHAKLRRYEELLKSHGVEIRPCSDGEESDSESVSEPRLHTPVEEGPSDEQSYYTLKPNPRIIHKERSSRYIDR